MARFEYEAVDRQGSNVRGEIEGTDQSAVVSELVTAGLTPVIVRPQSERRRFLAALVPRSGLGRRDVAVITRELTALLAAGLTLDRALLIVRNLSRSPAHRRLLDQLLGQVREGASFADALAENGDLFSPEYIGMVRAGQFSGTLPDVMARLARMLERRLEIQERMRSALTYPAILLAMMLVTLVLVVVVVLPRLESLFAEAQAELPLATRIVLAGGHFLQDFGWLVLACFLAMGAYALSWIRTPVGRARADRWLLRWRLSREFVAGSEFARFARVLGTLIGGGVAMPTAFRLALASVRNRVLIESLEAMLARVRAGESLPELLAGCPDAPPLLTNLTAVGHQTGQLDRMLVEAADLLDAEVQRATDRYLALMVPALTILMGVLVAGLIGSVLVGILSVNDLAL